MIIGTSGDAGDTIYELGILSELPDGPHTLLVQQDYITASGKQPEAFRSLMKNLVMAQPYIAEFRVELPSDSIWWHAGGFRRSGLHVPSRTLLASHVEHLVKTTGMGSGIKGLKPWLHVTPDASTIGRVVINRTARYHNHAFPWDAVVRHYGPRLLFVGLKNEHEQFCRRFGSVEFRPCNDLLEVAELIAGSELFIGNQSSPNAIAEGLKHRSIQETSPAIPDCIWVRPNAQHCYDGHCILPDIAGSGELATSPSMVKTAIINYVMHPPPGGWQWQGKFLSHGLEQAVAMMKRFDQFSTKDDIRRDLVAANTARCPEHFGDRAFHGNFDIVKLAIRNSPA